MTSQLHVSSTAVTRALLLVALLRPSILLVIFGRYHQLYEDIYITSTFKMCAFLKEGHKDSHLSNKQFRYYHFFFYQFHILRKHFFDKMKKVANQVLKKSKHFTLIIHYHTYQADHTLDV